MQNTSLLYEQDHSLTIQLKVSAKTFYTDCREPCTGDLPLEKKKSGAEKGATN